MPTCKLHLYAGRSPIRAELYIKSRPRRARLLLFVSFTAKPRLGQGTGSSIHPTKEVVKKRVIIHQASASSSQRRCQQYLIRPGSAQATPDGWFVRDAISGRRRSGPAQRLNHFSREVTLALSSGALITILKGKSTRLPGIHRKPGRANTSCGKNAPCDCAQYWRTAPGRGQRGAALELLRTRARRSHFQHRLHCQYCSRGPNPGCRQEAGHVRGLAPGARNCPKLGLGMNRGAQIPPRLRPGMHGTQKTPTTPRAFGKRRRRPLV